MSERLFLVESDAKGLRAALVENRRLQAIEIDRGPHTRQVGSVQPARVVRAARGLGTFIRLDDGREFLLDSEINKTNQSLVVQIRRLPRGGKLGTASQSVSLAGHGVIHLPFDSGTHFSRRLTADRSRQMELTAAVVDRSGGWIFRQTAALVPGEDLAAEIAALAADGAAARSGVTIEGPDAFRRLASDYGAPVPDRVLTAGMAAKKAVEAWCDRFAPGLKARVVAAEPGLFDHYDLDEAIAGLAKSRAPLAGGGWLSIEPTEALVVVDVNSGHEKNILSANLEAVDEIARQLKLRHLGGLIAIDFISMNRPADRARVVAALKSAMANDPARVHILPMSAFGLVEMTRERRGPGLELE
jgi:ribonuclease E/ribonuclease G